MVLTTNSDSITDNVSRNSFFFSGGVAQEEEEIVEIQEGVGIND